MPERQLPQPLQLSTDDFVRHIRQPQRQVDRLQAGVDLIVRLVDGCDHAGVTVTVGQSVMTAAASDDLVRQGDSWQYELDQGPCLQTVRTEHTVLSQDLCAEHRWPLWSPRVVAAGVHAMMCLVLATHQTTMGALNLYSDRRGAWSDNDVTIAHTLAGHLALALADARELERRRATMERTVIGQAEGILMERNGIGAEQALDHLHRISRSSNRELIAVAEDIVATRRTYRLCQPEGPAA